MNFLNLGAQGGEAVRCSAWLGGMALLLVYLLLCVRVTVEGDVLLTKPLGLERCLRRLVRFLRQLGWRLQIAGLLVCKLALDVFYALLDFRKRLLRVVFIHRLYVDYGVMPPNDPSSATRPKKGSI